jgi:hypothetical protein
MEKTTMPGLKMTTTVPRCRADVAGRAGFEWRQSRTAFWQNEPEVACTRRLIVVIEEF